MILLLVYVSFRGLFLAPSAYQLMITTTPHLWNATNVILISFSNVPASWNYRATWMLDEIRRQGNANCSQDYPIAYGIHFHEWPLLPLRISSES